MPQMEPDPPPDGVPTAHYEAACSPIHMPPHALQAKCAIQPAYLQPIAMWQGRWTHMEDHSQSLPRSDRQAATADVRQRSIHIILPMMCMNAGAVCPAKHVHIFSIRGGDNGSKASRLHRGARGGAGSQKVLPVGNRGVLRGCCAGTAGTVQELQTLLQGLLELGEVQELQICSVQPLDSPHSAEETHFSHSIQ